MTTLEEEQDALRHQIRVLRRVKRALDELNSKHRNRVVRDIAEAYLDPEELAALIDEWANKEAT